MSPMKMVDIEYSHLCLYTDQIEIPACRDFLFHYVVRSETCNKQTVNIHQLWSVDHVYSQQSLLEILRTDQEGAFCISL